MKKQAFGSRTKNKKHQVPEKLQKKSSKAASISAPLITVL
jgi:hypothetical protein